MTERYSVRVSLESYESEGEFYLVGNGHGTPADALRHVGADHIMRIDQNSFWTGGRVVQIGREPTRKQLREIAEGLDS